MRWSFIEETKFSYRTGAAVITISRRRRAIGPDGKLWWSVGDNVPSISNGQTLTNIYGKILLFNLDGSVPSDNPFVNVPHAVPYIYAYGLRNPWRFTFLPNGQTMTEDTGSSYWEDLNVVQPGRISDGR